MAAAAGVGDVDVTSVQFRCMCMCHHLIACSCLANAHRSVRCWMQNSLPEYVPIHFNIISFMFLLPKKFQCERASAWIVFSLIPHS